MEIDLSQVPKAVRDRMDEIFRSDFELKTLQAIRRQTRRAAINHLHRPRSRDDFGPRVLEVDTQIDAVWRQFYGSNYSEDEDLVKFLARRNPEIAVRARGTKDIFVGWTPGLSAAALNNSKFHKIYPSQKSN